MAHQHQPVGDQRGRRVVALADRGRVPPVPPGLEGRAGVIWRDLWALDVAAAWRPGDDALVARLCVLRARLEVDPDAPASLFGSVLALERQLYLTPQARRVLGVDVPEATPPVRGKRISARDRSRLLRG